MVAACEHDELAGLVPRERAEVLRKERIVLELNRLLWIGREEKLKAHDVTRAYAAMLQSRGLKVSAGTLWQWRRNYRDGLAGLIDRRGEACDRRPLERRCPRLLREILSLYCSDRYPHRSPRIRRNYCIDLALINAREPGWKVAPFRELATWLDKKLSPRVAPVQRRPKADRTAFDGRSIAN